MMKGIDVSENNGVVDWEAVAAAGYKFAIVRCSYGQHEWDEYFAVNVKGAHDAGLLVGAYHYGYGLSVEDAAREAENCMAALDYAGVELDLPLFYDMEDADGYKDKHDFAFDPAEMTAMCKTFIDAFKGILDVGVYASYSWFEEYIDWKSLNCPIWNAQWSECDDFKGYMWQYTDCAVIGGKYFDANIIYGE